MTLEGLRLALFGFSIVWAMLVFWNFSTLPFWRGAPLAIAVIAIPILSLYLAGRLASWLLRRLRT